MTGVEALYASRREDWRRHVRDLQTRTYEGAQARADRERVFVQAFTLITPAAVRVLEALNDAYLGGRGSVETIPPGRVAAAELVMGARRQLEPGLVGSWNLSWPELDRSRSRLTGLPVPPVQIFAIFPDDFTHGHLALFDLDHPRRCIACWPLQVASPEDADRQEQVLAAMAEAEMHERTFETDLNWRLLELSTERTVDDRPSVVPD